MVYQVIVRDTLARTWRKYGEVQREWESAKRMLALASAPNHGKEVFVVEAPTEAELGQKLALLDQGVEAQVVSLPANLSPDDKKRLDIERGAGGDHDEPYLFRMAQELPVWQQWLDIWRRYANGELGGANDGGARRASGSGEAPA